MTVQILSQRGWWAWSILILAASSGLFGCRAYAPPRLGVSSARVTEQTPLATVVQFELTAENTNAVELPLRQIRYSLAIDGREVFRGVRSPEASLRRLGKQTFTIPAVLVQESDGGAGGGAFAGTRSYTLAGTLEYITPGSIAQIFFDTGVNRPSVGFREQGSIEFLPPAPAPAVTPAPAPQENSGAAGES